MSDQYGQYGYQTLESNNNEVPVEVALYQTPKRALASPRYIGGLITGAIGGFLINWGIGALLNIGKDILFLWKSVDKFSQGSIEHNPGGAIWVDLLLTITLAVFLGSPLTHTFIKCDVAATKAKPIQGHDLQKFRFLGTTLSNIWARSLVYTLYATAFIYPAFLVILHIACKNNGMYISPIPPDFDSPGECYMTKTYYVLLKGIAAALAGVSVSWMLEWGSLNKDNLPEEVFEAHAKKAQEQAKEQSLIANGQQQV